MIFRSSNCWLKKSLTSPMASLNASTKSSIALSKLSFSSSSSFSRSSNALSISSATSPKNSTNSSAISNKQSTSGPRLKSSMLLCDISLVSNVPLTLNCTKHWMESSALKLKSSPSCSTSRIPSSRSNPNNSNFPFKRREISGLLLNSNRMSLNSNTSGIPNSLISTDMKDISQNNVISVLAFSTSNSTKSPEAVRLSLLSVRLTAASVLMAGMLSCPSIFAAKHGIVPHEFST
mmetsp:Transcript_14109/g.15848  ORF Transcript_14109/g.15848 Transcript_14109/m.15848 type:complete len:234 (+) Transcript_14109:3089-3790(+)